MKREVSFFKDKRARSGSALLETMRSVGMSDAEIKVALLKVKSDEAYAKVQAARSIRPDAVSAAYNEYRDAYARWYAAAQAAQEKQA